jgi:hypothetical protein
MKNLNKEYGRVKSILNTKWDPIGVSNVTHAQDEYDSYVGSILTLIRRGADVVAIRDRLLEIETLAMGLPGDKNRATAVAVALREIQERP